MATQSASSTLNSIPLEVLLQITSYLTTPDHGNVRLTCKAIENLVFESFSREFFTKRQFMLTEFSLKALVDISKSRFASSLNHVILGIERPSLKHARFVNNQQTLSGSRSDILEKQDNLLKEYMSHMDLINTGHDVELLTEAFSNLRSLETVGIRDFYSRSRNRDYPNVEWRSYGVSTFVAQTNSRLERPRPVHFTHYVHHQGALSAEAMDDCNYISRVFGNALRGLGKADSRPKHFEVILREFSMPDPAFTIPEYTSAVVQPVLDNLRTLLLDIGSSYPPTHIDVGGTAAECPDYMLRKFLARLPELEHLRLNFRAISYDPATNRASSLLKWIASPVSTVSPSTPGTVFPPAPASIEFTKIRQLEIGMVSVEPKILLDIIRKHRGSLCNISLHKVTLIQTDESKPRENLWAKFFTQLSKFDLKLTGLKMSILAQERKGKQHHRPITFKDSKKGSSREWGGTNVESCLKDFVANTVVSGPDEDTASSNGSDGTDDEDEPDHDVIDLVSDLSGDETDADAY